MFALAALILAAATASPGVPTEPAFGPAPAEQRLPALHVGTPTDLPADLGPDLVILDQVQGCYGAVRFDHKLHVGMSQIGGGCTNCHHDAVGGAAIRQCRSCHDAVSSPIKADGPGLKGAYHRQCLSCHREWAHQNACGFCHQDASSLAGTNSARLASTARSAPAQAKASYVYHTAHKGVPVVTFHHADHAEVFGLSCTDCHAGQSCNQCHGPGTERLTIKRESACMKCHADQKCVTCHDLAERPRFDHAACVGWRFRPGHKDLACADCHADSRPFKRPASAACRACHGAETGGVFNHESTGVALYGDHEYFDCTDCHAGGNDRLIARCTKCHDERPVAGKRVVGWDPLLTSPAPEPVDD